MLSTATSPDKGKLVCNSYLNDKFTLREGPEIDGLSCPPPPLLPPTLFPSAPSACSGEPLVTSPCLVCMLCIRACGACFTQRFVLCRGAAACRPAAQGALLAAAVQGDGPQGDLLPVRPHRRPLALALTRIPLSAQQETPCDCFIHLNCSSPSEPRGKCGLFSNQMRNLPVFSFG